MLVSMRCGSSLARVALSVFVGLLLAIAVVGRALLELHEFYALRALHERSSANAPNARNALGATSSVEVMNPNDAATIYYPSKQITWVTGGQPARFKVASFVPPRGPNGGMLHVRRFVAHAVLNATIATASLLGQNKYRAFRTIDVSLVGSPVKVFENITGDSLRVIDFAQEGSGGTFEHQDSAAAAAANYNFTASIPLSHPFAYDPDDTAIPSELLDEVAIGMATDANMSLGTSAVTINSGYYYLIAECYESMAIVLPSLSVWRQVEGTAVSQVDYEVDTGGRLQDLLFMIPGDIGGSLANLSKAGILFSQDQKLAKDPDLKHIFARARNEETNLFSTLGNPVYSSPFLASDSGTLRAIAVRLTTGSKVTDGKERAKEVLKLELSANLPAVGRVLTRFTVPKSDGQRAIIERTQRDNGDMWYVKTRDKSRRPAQAWPDAMRAYLPERWGKKR